MFFSIAGRSEPSAELRGLRLGISLIHLNMQNYQREPKRAPSFSLCQGSAVSKGKLTLGVSEELHNKHRTSSEQAHTGKPALLQNLGVDRGGDKQCHFYLSYH